MNTLHRRHSRSPNAAAEGPLLRRRVYRGPTTETGEAEEETDIINNSSNSNNKSSGGRSEREGGPGERRPPLSAGEWQQLYNRVLPNPLRMPEFQRALLEGKVHDYLLAKDLHKLVMELRAILENHGELRLAAKLSVKGRKAELSHAAAAALKLLESERRHMLAEDIRASAGPIQPQPQSVTHNSRLVHSCVSDRGLGVVTGITEASMMHTSSNTGDEDAFIRSSSLSPGENRRIPLRTTNTTITTNPTTNTTTTNINTNTAGITTSTFNNTNINFQATLDNTLSDTFKNVEGRDNKDEIFLMNNSSSPFTHVLHIVKRFQLRFGSIPLRFEIPVQYVESIISRRLRVQLVPFRLPAIPTRWPTSKDIVVYVNDQCVMTPWKRSWPERRVEVAKTFLPLDITQFLNRNSSFQRLQINIFAREYFSQVALLIVQPLSPEEVMSELIKPLNSTYESRDSLNYSLYRNAVEDEDTFMGEVEVDDPVITSKCPILQTRISVPIRGSRCKHLQCFDCQSYLLSCHKGCYWNCPLCDTELRPCDVVVDTVLWRYLLEVGDNCPLHLRLITKRNKENEIENINENDNKNSTITKPFYWIPNRMTGDVHDIILDENDDDSNHTNKEERERNFQSYTFSKTENGSQEICTTYEVERNVFDFNAQLGTADCPIEL